jgi:ribosomal protein S12 methylthiotransferase
VDIYHKYALLDLLDELEKLEIEWIRLMYCYPELVSDELIDRVAAGGKVVRYLDIPLQHISNGILKRMNRRNTKEDAYKLLDRIRKKDENISIRSTFITGFPGETEDEFNELLDFVRYAELDNAGFFAYSREDNTPAYKMKEQLAKRTKQSRTDRLYAAQTETLLNKYKGYIGREFTVMYEGIDYNRQCFYGRSYMSAPGIDSRILFKGSNLKAPGEFINTRITGNNELDLVAEIIED